MPFIITLTNTLRNNVPTDVFRNMIDLRHSGRKFTEIYIRRLVDRVLRGTSLFQLWFEFGDLTDVDGKCSQAVIFAEEFETVHRPE